MRIGELLPNRVREGFCLSSSGAGFWGIGTLERRRGSKFRCEEYLRRVPI